MLEYVHKYRKILYATLLFVTVKATAQPTIASFTPSKGPVGTSVTITGTNFNPSANNNIVYFGAVKASVTSGNTTTLTVTAPAGATYKPISVLNNVNGLTGYSSKPFITTFNNPYDTITQGSFYKPKIDFASGSNPQSLAVSDIDGDGKPDFAVANSGSNTISVLRNISSSGSIGSSSFAPKVDFISGTAPYSVVLADLDGDGKPDMIVANSTASTISVLHNTSVAGTINASSFANKVDFATNATPWFISIADIDKDGRPEILVANYSSDVISVFRNISATGVINTLSFAPKVDFASGVQPTSIALGDLDNDNKPDLVIANSGSNTVSVLRNTSITGSIGIASFAAGVDFATGDLPFCVAIGDMDGDGKPDLAVANFYSNTVSLLRNTSASGIINTFSFAAKEDFASGVGPRYLAMGDLNGDGKPDLAVANQLTNNLSLLRNTAVSGSINQSSFAGKVDFYSGAYPYCVTIADLNQDGIPELEASNYFSNTISVLEIGPPPLVIASIFPTSGPVGTIVTLSGRSFNGVSTNNVVYFGAVRATITSSSSNTLTCIAPAGATYQPISIYNSETRLTGFSSKQFIPTFTHPFGTAMPGNFLSPQVDFTVGPFSESVASADLDGDGKPDLVTVNKGSNTISVLRNTSSSGMINLSSFASKVDFATGTSPVFVAIADLDGDGKPDLLIANNGANTISFFHNTSTPGSISPASFDPKIDFVTNNLPTSIAISDLDKDGKPDAVVTGSSNDIAVLHNSTSTLNSIGTLSFDPKINFTAGSNPQSISIGDMDGDEKPELIVANHGSNTISILRNTSTPGSINATSFATKVDFASGISPLAPCIGDIDGDGKPDIVVVNETANNLSILRNTSTPGSINSSSFANKIDFGTGTDPVSLAIGDITGDGKPDVVVANYASSTISILRNTSTSGNIDASSLATKLDFFYRSSPNSITMGDINGDGITDIITGNENAASVLQISSPPPTINSFNPPSGEVFTPVTISGANFNPVPTDNIIFYGAAKATVTSGSLITITTIATPGATYFPISLLDKRTGLSAYSTKPFITTFSNPFGTHIPSNFYLPGVNFAANSNTRAVAIGDVDGDGKPDLVAANQGSQDISVFLNTSVSGRITASSFAVPLNFATNQSNTNIAIEDLDGDGKPDLLASSRDPGFYNRFKILRNNSSPGIITFTSSFSSVCCNSGNYYSVCITDLDGDGRPDIVATNGTSISIYRNYSYPGNISFALIYELSLNSSARCVIVGDIDGDGKPDLVVAYVASSTISVFRNTFLPGIFNDFSFASRIDFGTGAHNAVDLALGDLDGNGKADIVMAWGLSSTPPSGVSVLRNFSNPGIINFSFADCFQDYYIHFISVLIGDLDGDGKPDILSGSYGLRNTCPVTVDCLSSFELFHLPTSLGSPTSSNNSENVAIGDLDGDGVPEVVSADNVSSLISVLQTFFSTDYFRTKASGDWNDINTWESSADNINWQVASMIPTYKANTITILNSHTVTVTANVSVDQLIINPGGSVVVNSGINFTVK